MLELIMIAKTSTFKVNYFSKVVEGLKNEGD